MKLLLVFTVKYVQMLAMMAYSTKFQGFEVGMETGSIDHGPLDRDILSIMEAFFKAWLHNCDSRSVLGNARANLNIAPHFVRPLLECIWSDLPAIIKSFGGQF